MWVQLLAAIPGTAAAAGALWQAALARRETARLLAAARAEQLERELGIGRPAELDGLSPRARALILLAREARRRP